MLLPIFASSGTLLARHLSMSCNHHRSGMSAGHALDKTVSISIPPQTQSPRNVVRSMQPCLQDAPHANSPRCCTEAWCRVGTRSVAGARTWLVNHIDPVDRNTWIKVARFSALGHSARVRTTASAAALMSRLSASRPLAFAAQTSHMLLHAEGASPKCLQQGRSHINALRGIHTVTDCFLTLLLTSCTALSEHYTIVCLADPD